jgi:4-amino-4-deoxy-L-arabinose transferase-like glycosyltransferase
MVDPDIKQSFLRRRRGWTLLVALIIVLTATLYVANIRDNPPGFYIDESSIAFNAHLIAQTGKDEHGESFPLFFRAFGEYKNPVYIYLLAAVFRITGPNILAARLLSAFLLYASALVLGLLAARLSGSRAVGLIVLITALMTPWFFELSRIVLEVALYPLILSVFLLNLRRLTRVKRWSWLDAGSIAVLLALLTYSYSIGRMFAPLLALGLLFYLPCVKWVSIRRVWLLYALLLVPLLLFQLRHPTALASRFHIITYSTADSSYAGLAWEFVKHYVGNFNPWRMVVRGDPNNRQVAAIYGLGQVLAATFVLALFGLVVIWRESRRDPWWRFVVYGLAVCAVPAALTRDYFHILRLAPMPVFLVLLCVPALSWLVAHQTKRVWRFAFVAAVILTLVQGALFQWQYRNYGRSPYRAQLFDADYPARILSPALAQSSRPIYLADAEPIPSYIQSFWYATLQGHSLIAFKRLSLDALAPAGSVVITTEDIRPRCRELAQVEPYTLCRMEGEPQRQLSASMMRAELRAINPPASAKAQQKFTLHISATNRSGVLWLARERGAAPMQLYLGNHWLDTTGREVIHDDGRAPLIRNLRPGEEVELDLIVNAPKLAGNYILELDMLQEGVSWFASQGSSTVRLPIKVE